MMFLNYRKSDTNVYTDGTTFCFLPVSTILVSRVKSYLISWNKRHA